MLRYIFFSINTQVHNQSEMPLGFLLQSELLNSYFSTVHFHIISATSNVVHLINVI